MVRTTRRSTLWMAAVAECRNRSRVRDLGATALARGARRASRNAQSGDLAGEERFRRGALGLPRYRRLVRFT
jgi:Ni/Co efflux regulator RcnB